jgi:hypothetical protein
MKLRDHPLMPYRGTKVASCLDSVLYGYGGCLLFDDATFCLQIQHLLRHRCGCSIESVGGLHVSRIL